MSVLQLYVILFLARGEPSHDVLLRDHFYYHKLTPVVTFLYQNPWLEVFWQY